jgi:hypothetical protein
MLGGIAGVLVAWGYTLSGIQRDTDRNTVNVSALLTAMEKNDSKTDQLETRLIAVEKIAADAIQLRRELEGTLSEFHSDIAVIKEILTRMDKDKTKTYSLPDRKGGP